MPSVPQQVRFPNHLCFGGKNQTIYCSPGSARGGVPFSKAETPERMRLISVDAIFSETLKRLCVSDSVSKRFDQV
jgi:hypothetical protein